MWTGVGFTLHGVLASPLEHVVSPIPPVGCPSCCESLRPQQTTSPPISSAQAKPAPAEIAVTWARSGTGAGIGRQGTMLPPAWRHCSVVPAVPSCPNSSPPQHHTWPFFKRAHAKSSPALKSTTLSQFVTHSRAASDAEASLSPTSLLRPVSWLASGAVTSLRRPPSPASDTRVMGIPASGGGIAPCRPINVLQAQASPSADVNAVVSIARRVLRTSEPAIRGWAVVASSRGGWLPRHGWTTRARSVDSLAPGDRDRSRRV